MNCLVIHSSRLLAAFFLSLTFPGLGLGQSIALPLGTGKNPSVRELEEILDEQIDITFLQKEMSLKTALERLTQFLKEKKKTLPIVVERSGFREDNPDAEDPEETAVKLPMPLRMMKVRQVLRTWINQIKTRDADFMVKPGYVEITVERLLNPWALLLYERVNVRFRARPLHQALEDLYDQTGIAVVIDSRVGELANTAITAQFREITLGDALLVMSEMANVKLLTKEDGRLILLTTPALAKQIMGKETVHSYGLPTWRLGLPDRSPKIVEN